MGTACLVYGSGAMIFSGRAVGVVGGVIEGHNGGIAFSYEADGRTYYAESNAGSSSAQVGDRLTVFYDRFSPGRGYTGSGLAEIMLIGAGLTAAGIMIRKLFVSRVDTGSELCDDEDQAGSAEYVQGFYL